MFKVGDYTLYKVLGKGSFGEVYLTQKANNPEILATKKLDKKQTDRPSVKKYFDNEISIMKELIHPNIVRFYDLLATYSHYYVVMEYCNGGGLSNCLAKYKQLYRRPFSQEIVQYLMRQIIEGLKFIHSRKIIHRDIKLDNILVSFSKESDKNSLNMLKSKVKIIDFGLATRLGPENLTYTALGSPINMDPLILKKYNKAGGYNQLQGYNEKADIWSLGTVCYELLTGEAIFKVRDLKDLMKKVENGTYTIPLNVNFSKEAVSFLNAMLQYDGDDRLSAEELSKHDFLVKNVRDFTQVDLRMISNKIDEHGLNINVKANQTIWDIFNNEPQEVKPMVNQINNNKNNQNINNNQYNQINNNQYNNLNDQFSYYNRHKSPEQQRRNTKEENYISRNNIYDYNNNNNPNYYDNRNPEVIPQNNNFVRIPIYDNYNKPNGNHRRFTEGFISPYRMDKRIEYERKKESKFSKNEDTEKNNIRIYDKKDSEKSEKSEKEKEDINKYLNALLEEYKSAKEYFKSNDLKNQEEDANQKYNQIQNAKKRFEQGYSIKNNLPKPITPEYIYGCSTEERDSKFKQVLDKYTSDKNELETKIKESILNLKKLDSEKYAKIKPQVMPKLESEKAKLDTLKKVIEGFEKRYKNKWVPAPKISKGGDENQDNSNANGDYKLNIHVGETNYEKDNLVLIVLFRINKDKLLSKEIKLKKFGDFDEEINWSIKPEEWNNVGNYLLMLDYFYVDSKNKSGVKLNINKINEIKELLFECPIDLYPENITIKININIKLIKPEDKKTSEEGKKESISVKKIYPAFEGKSSETDKIPSCL